MSLISENVIPGNHGKIFGTNAREEKDLKRIAQFLSRIHGVEDVMINLNAFPKEFTIHSSALIKVDTIQKEVQKLGFHAIPKGLFQLAR